MAQSSIFPQNSWVWVPDPHDCFVPAQAMQTFTSEDTTFPASSGLKKEDGSVIPLTPALAKCVTTMDEESLGSLEDMVKLNNLSEAPLLHNLRKRFVEDNIYTLVGPILVAVNPFRTLPIYTLDVLGRYTASSTDDLPPHAYSISAASYRSLTRNLTTQAVCITGESGSGKTETMKLMLQFLAEVSSRQGSSGEMGFTGGMSIEEKILQTNPVTESFGNAKTLRNNNSSRFGKWTKLFFSTQGAILGASITNYLLEKSRVSQQSTGERNYHIFYQLIAGLTTLDPVLQTQLRVHEASHHRYTSGGSCTSVSGINDASEFQATTAALANLDASVEDVAKVVAAILHFGDVQINEENDVAVLAEHDTLQMAADLLSIPEAELARSIMSRIIGTGDIDVVQVPLTKLQAENARDALARSVYSSLFDWAITMINTNLSRGVNQEDPQQLFIGVLDIFGFEFFETNSLEQLCINLCNEKLQFFFNDHIFALELREYEAEGVDVGLITFPTNEPVLTVLTGKGGVFKMLDEEIAAPGASDSKYLNRLLSAHSDHPNIETNLKRRGDFVVVHYAGKVSYTATGFVEKNKDQLLHGLKVAVEASTSEFVAGLFKTSERIAEEQSRLGSQIRGRYKKAWKSLGRRFLQQMTNLVDVLNSCEPHFIRCVKPNTAKVARRFESTMVLEQIRCAGLLEVCRIRRDGFPHRRPFNEFLGDFKIIADHLSPTSHPITLTCVELLDVLEEHNVLKRDSRQSPGNFTIGHTKVFMRPQGQIAVGKAKEAALVGRVVKLQTWVRTCLARQNLRFCKDVLEQLAMAMASDDEQIIVAALKPARRLPFNGSGHPQVREARKRVEALAVMRQWVRRSEEAVAARKLADLNKLLQEVEALPRLRISCASAVEVVEKLARYLEAEPEVLAALEAAVKARELKALTAVLDRAKELAMPPNKLLLQARELLSELDGRRAVQEGIHAAVECVDFTLLEAMLAKAAAVLKPEELADVTFVDEARQLHDAVVQERRARITLTKASIAAQATKDDAPLLPALDEARRVFAAQGGKDLEFNPGNPELPAHLREAAVVHTTASPGLMRRTSSMFRQPTVSSGGREKGDSLSAKQRRRMMSFRGSADVVAAATPTTAGVVSTSPVQQRETLSTVIQDAELLCKTIAVTRRVQQGIDAARVVDDTAARVDALRAALDAARTDADFELVQGDNVVTMALERAEAILQRSENQLAFEGKVAELAAAQDKAGLSAAAAEGLAQSLDVSKAEHALAQIKQEEQAARAAEAARVAEVRRDEATVELEAVLNDTAGPADGDPAVAAVSAASALIDRCGKDGIREQLGAAAADPFDSAMRRAKALVRAVDGVDAAVAACDAHPDDQASLSALEAALAACAAPGDPRLTPASSPKLEAASALAAKRNKELAFAARAAQVLFQDDITVMRELLTELDSQLPSEEAKHTLVVGAWDAQTKSRIQEMRGLVHRQDVEQQVNRGIEAAVASEDIDTLQAAIQHAASFKVESSAVVQAHQLLNDLQIKATAAAEQALLRKQAAERHANEVATRRRMVEDRIESTLRVECLAVQPLSTVLHDASSVPEMQASEAVQRCQRLLDALTSLEAQLHLSHRTREVEPLARELDAANEVIGEIVGDKLGAPAAADGELSDAGGLSDAEEEEDTFATFAFANPLHGQASHNHRERSMSAVLGFEQKDGRGPLVAAARALLAHLEVEDELRHALRAANNVLSADDLEEVAEAVEKANHDDAHREAVQRRPSLQHFVKDCRALLKRLEGERAAASAIEDAMAQRDMAALEEAVHDGIQRNLDVREAQALLRELHAAAHDEMEATANLEAARRAEEELNQKRRDVEQSIQAAMEAQDVGAVSQRVQDAAFLGLYDDSSLVVADARRWVAVIDRIEAASENDNVTELRAALDAAKAADVRTGRVAAAQEYLDIIDAEQATLDKITQAISAHDVQGLEDALASLTLADSVLGSATSALEEDSASEVEGEEGAAEGADASGVGLAATKMSQSTRQVQQRLAWHHSTTSVNTQLEQAKIRLTSLKLEAEVEAQLAEAVATRDIAALDAAIARGVSCSVDVAEAQRLRAELQLAQLEAEKEAALQQARQEAEEEFAAKRNSLLTAVRSTMAQGLDTTSMRELIREAGLFGMYPSSSEVIEEAKGWALAVDDLRAALDASGRSRDASALRQSLDRLVAHESKFGSQPAPPPSDVAKGSAEAKGSVGAEEAVEAERSASAGEGEDEASHPPAAPGNAALNELKGQAAALVAALEAESEHKRCLSEAVAVATAAVAHKGRLEAAVGLRAALHAVPPEEAGSAWHGTLRQAVGEAHAVLGRIQAKIDAQVQLAAAMAPAEDGGVLDTTALVDAIAEARDQGLDVADAHRELRERQVRQGAAAEAAALSSAKAKAQDKFNAERAALEAKLLAAIDDKSEEAILGLIKEAAFLGLGLSEADENAVIGQAKAFLAVLEQLQEADSALGECNFALSNEVRTAEEQTDLDVCRLTLANAHELLAQALAQPVPEPPPPPPPPPGASVEAPELPATVQDFNTLVSDLAQGAAQLAGLLHKVGKMRHLEAVLITALEVKSAASIAALEDAIGEARELQLKPDSVEDAQQALEKLRVREAAVAELGAARQECGGGMAAAADGDGGVQGCPTSCAAPEDLAALVDLVGRAHGVVEDEHEHMVWAEHRIALFEALQDVRACVDEAEASIDKGLVASPLQINTLQGRLDLALQVEGMHVFSEIARLKGALETLREELVDAQSDESHFSKFPRLRRADDMADSVRQNSKRLRFTMTSGRAPAAAAEDKGAAADGPVDTAHAEQCGSEIPVHLRFSALPLQTSLTELTRETDIVRAKICNRNILGFCGDLAMLYPVALAVDLLQTGWSDEASGLGDEVLVQLCRHLTMNSGARSRQLGWFLMKLCLQHFAPSASFEPFLRNFLIAEVEAKAAMIWNVAAEALSQLDQRLESGSVAELKSADDVQDELDAAEHVERMRIARRKSMVQRKKWVMDMQDSLQAMERFGADESFPEELREALKIKERYGVNAAWDHLQTMKQSENVQQSLTACAETAREHLFQPEGCDALTLESIRQEIDIAHCAKLHCTELQVLEQLLHCAEQQAKTAAHLGVAIKSRNPERLQAAVAEATDGGRLDGRSFVTQLHVYEDALELNAELNPGFAQFLSDAGSSIDSAMGGLFSKGLW